MNTTERLQALAVRLRGLIGFDQEKLKVMDNIDRYIISEKQSNKLIEMEKMLLLLIEDEKTKNIMLN